MKASLNTLDKTHYTTAQAAEALGKTTGRIRQLARAGKLKGAEVFGTGYVIPRATIDALKGANGKPAATNGHTAAVKRKPAAKKLRKIKAKATRRKRQQAKQLRRRKPR